MKDNISVDAVKKINDLKWEGFSVSAENNAQGDRKNYFRVIFTDQKNRSRSAYFHFKDSNIGLYIQLFLNKYYKDRNDKDKRVFLSVLKRIGRLQHEDPDNKNQLNAYSAALALIASGQWNDDWKKLFDKEDKNPKYQEFFNLIASSKPEYLKYYIDSGYISNFAEIFIENKFNLALSLRLFVSNFAYYPNQKDSENFFEAYRKTLILLRQDNLDEKIKKAASAHLLLIASGLSEKESGIKDKDNKVLKFSELDLTEYPKLCDFLVNKLTEKDLRESREWLSDFLKVYLLDPKKDLEIINVSPTFSFSEQLLNSPKVLDKKYARLAVVEKVGQDNSGSFGTTRIAYPYDHVKKEFIFTKPLVWKTTNEIKFYENKISDEELKKINDRFNETKIEVKKEAELNVKSGSKAYQPIQTSKTQFGFAQEYAPGKDMGFSYINELLQGKSLAERAKLAQQFAMAIANVHKKGIFHGDIKTANLRLNIGKNKFGEIIFNVKPIDFGISKEMMLTDEYEDEMDFSIDFLGGTPAFMPFEIAQSGRAYVTSDAYSCTPIYLAILGVENPLSTKLQFDRNEPNKTISAPFDYTGFLESVTIPEEYEFIKLAIRNFVNRSDSQNYRDRPTDEESLIFWNSLVIFDRIIKEKDNLNLTQVEKERLIKQLEVCSAKMILLGHKYWNEPVVDKIEVKKLNLELYPDECRKLISDYKKTYEKDKNIGDFINTRRSHDFYVKTFGDFEACVNNDKTRIEELEKNYKNFEEFEGAYKEFKKNYSEYFKLDNVLNQTPDKTVRYQDLNFKFDSDYKFFNSYTKYKSVHEKYEKYIDDYSHSNPNFDSKTYENKFNQAVYREVSQFTGEVANQIKTQNHIAVNNAVNKIKQLGLWEEKITDKLKFKEFNYDANPAFCNELNNIIDNFSNVSSQLKIKHQSALVKLAFYEKVILDQESKHKDKVGYKLSQFFKGTTATQESQAIRFLMDVVALPDEASRNLKYFDPKNKHSQQMVKILSNSRSELGKIAKPIIKDIRDAYAKQIKDLRAKERETKKANLTEKKVVRK